MYQLRSVDVWDTLLRRDCHPECIKAIVAQHLFWKHTDEIRSSGLDHHAVYKARLQAEQQLAEESLRAGGDGEYAIDAVVKRWLQLVAPSHDLQQSIRSLIDFEYATEVAHTEPDPAIHDLLPAHPAQQTIFLSDFYWPADMLRQLLVEKGFGDVVPDGISSCDVGLNKRSGRLFGHVLRKYGVAPDAVVHIGDNVHSDVAAARARGIRAVHFLPAEAHRHRLKREADFHDTDGAIVSFQADILRNSERAASRLDAGEAESFRAGVALAPLFVGHCLFVAEQAVSSGIDRLFFLTREGLFLKKLFDRLLSGGSFRGHELPPTAILDVSRVSTFTAALNGQLERIIDGSQWPYRGHTVSTVLDALGLEPNDVDAAMADAHLRADSYISDAASDRRLHAFLIDPRVRRVARRAADSRRSNVCRYLRQAGLSDAARCGVVDIGWRGSIQDNLGWIMPDVIFHGFYLLLLQQLSYRPENCAKHGFLTESQDVDVDGIRDLSALMETLCTCSVGTVLDYEPSAVSGRIEPVIDAGSVHAAATGIAVQRFQEGVAFACDAWKQRVEAYGYDSAIFRRSGVSAWHNLIARPPRAIVELYASTPLHDPYSAITLVKPSEPPSLRTIAAAVFHEPSRRRLVDYLRKVRWPHALRSCDRGIRSKRFILRLLLASASLVQRYRSVKRRWTAALTPDHRSPSHLSGSAASSGLHRPRPQD